MATTLHDRVGKCKFLFATTFSSRLRLTLRFQNSAIMAALPATIQTFSTFHSSTTALPAEISLDIISYASPNMLVLPMGGGVGMRRAHHSIASVSRALRQLYLSQPYPARAEERAMAPVRCRIGSALHFADLQTVAAFFQDGPGRDTEKRPW